MTNRAFGEEYRSTTVCLESYDNGVPVGHFHNRWQPEGRRFHGIVQFLSEMERCLDRMDFPQAYRAVRSFARPPNPGAAAPSLPRLSGAAATFTLRILFRQNASWQGSVIWHEGQREQSFRSVLELIFLMDSAMQQSRSP